MKFHKLPHFTRDVTGQHYRPVPSDVSLPRISERRRRLKFRLPSTFYCLIYELGHYVTKQLLSHIRILNSYGNENIQLLGDTNLQDYGLRKSRSVHLSTGRSDRPVLLYLQLKYVFRLKENAVDNYIQRFVDSNSK